MVQKTFVPVCVDKHNEQRELSIEQHTTPCSHKVHSLVEYLISSGIVSCLMFARVESNQLPRGQKIKFI